eukprot:contig_6363_g1445
MDLYCTYFRQAGAAPWRRTWIPLARGAGALLNLNSAVVLLPAVRVLVDYLRQSSVNLVLPLDHAMPFFHKVVACVLLGAGTFHGLVQTAALATAPAAHPMAGLLYTTGWLLVLAVAAMLTTAWSRCRQRYFELFQATHALGGLTYYAALLPHGMHRGRHVTGGGGGGLEILIEGPFGAPSEHVGQFEHVVLFAGGVGATVYVSVVKAIHHFMEGQRATVKAEAA